jgi:hypothetical protein
VYFEANWATLETLGQAAVRLHQIDIAINRNPFGFATLCLVRIDDGGPMPKREHSADS